MNQAKDTEVKLIFTIVVVVSLTAIALSIVLKVEKLPAAALVMACIWPAQYFAYYPTLWATRFTPALIVLLIWAIKVQVLGGASLASSRLGSVVFIFGLLLMVVNLNLARPDKATSWLLTVLIGLTLPNIISFDKSAGPTSTLLWRTWLFLSISLSTMAVLEALWNFSVLGSLFNFNQHWAVFRVTTLLGHPLQNAWFFAITLVMLIPKLASEFKRYLFPFMFTAVALVLTASSSGILATAVGGAFALVFGKKASRTPVRARLAGLLIFGVSVLAFVASPLLQSRRIYGEALSSADYRLTVFQLVQGLPKTDPWFGSGAGSSGEIFGALYPLPLENAWLGTFVSMGWLGTIWLFMNFVAAGIKSWNQKNIGATAAIIAGAIMGAAFPAWEYAPCILVFIGLLPMLTEDSGPQCNENEFTK